MNGVEILSSQPVYNTYIPEWWATIAFMFLGIAFIVGISLMMNDYPIAGVLIVVVGIVVFAAGMYYSLTGNKNDINHWEHKVIVDDSVPMTEFLDKYEILDQEGKIYTVKERE